jgi:hypothetical protein
LVLIQVIIVFVDDNNLWRNVTYTLRIRVNCVDYKHRTGAVAPTVA